MRPKTLLLLVVAIACGLAAAFMVSQLSGSGKTTEQDTVLVPKTDIPPGVKIDVKTMFMQKQFPKGTLPVTVIREPDKLNGQVPTRILTANLPVMDRDLHSHANIMAQLKEGFRAVTVQADVKIGVAGFLHPGMMVDVLTIIRDVDNPQVSKSQIFLQNVQVLAVNTLSEKPQDKPNINNPTSLTLMLEPDDVERLLLAASKGTIGVALRKPGDKETVKTDGATNPLAESEGVAGSAPPVNVAVAIQDIPEGREIDRFDNFFKFVPYQESQIAGALVITDPSKVQGRKLTRFLAKGQPATEANFTPLGVTPPTLADKTQHVLTIYNGAKEESRVFGGPSGGTPATLPPGKKLSPGSGSEAN